MQYKKPNAGNIVAGVLAKTATNSAVLGSRNLILPIITKK